MWNVIAWQKDWLPLSIFTVAIWLRLIDFFASIRVLSPFVSTNIDIL